MNVLTDGFYWISTGLLVPVMVFLLVGFAYSLGLIGGFYAHYRDRRRYRIRLRELQEQQEDESIAVLDFSEWFASHPYLLRALKNAQQRQWREPHTSKALADFEITAEKQLEGARTLMRVGPMLGLMGTLIPMGPALVGLAAGDIASMALHMQVAFSTTVIGVFVGAVGFILYTVRRRWFTEDSYQLQYFIQLAEHEEQS